MIDLDLTRLDGNTERLSVPDECIVGKHKDCDLRLRGWLVGLRHMRIFRTAGGIFIDDLGSYRGVEVNGERIGDRYGPLNRVHKIAIGRYLLRIAPSVEPCSDPAIPEAADFRDSPIVENFLATGQVRVETATRGLKTFADFGNQYDHDVEPEALNTASQEVELAWRQRIHVRLLQAMDLRRRDVSSMSDEELRREVGNQINLIIEDLGSEIPPELDRTDLARLVLDEAVGLGPLEPLLADESVTEVMVNRHDEIYVERSGRLLPHHARFSSEQAVVGVIERIVTPLGRRIDEASPMVDARLRDGSRVNAVIPPLALRGASLTIRKFARRKMTFEDLVARGGMSAEMAEFLRICVVQRKNIVVSGGTGSGKTTLLNILSNFIPKGERIVTVEDAAELQLNHSHLVSLEGRPANAEGKGAVTIRDLVRNTLRMRPDRIVIGECRGAEALDMLQAMNTGHEGSLTTLHANSTRDALARLETMVLMAGMDLPLIAIREQIASAVDIIVQQVRFACGTRLISSISEVTGMESGRFQIQELLRFASVGHEPMDGDHVGKVKGYFTACGIVPQFYEELVDSGVTVDLRIFDGKEQV